LAHPFNKFRQSNVERSRVGAITSEAKSVGGIDDGGAMKKTLKSLGDIGGVPAAMRMDRPQRASGGKVGKKATTVVNVITGGQQQPPAPPPMPMPPPGAMMPPPPPGPPPGAAPPPGGPMGGPPGLPPGPPMRARGGGVKSVGMNVGTDVQHKSAKAKESANLNRKRVVTFATGGGVVSFNAGGAVKGVVMKGGTPKTADAASKLPGGSGGGAGRLAEANRAARKR
jgi:hypothetical protein